MSYLNKLGLFLFLIGLQEFPPSNDWHGVFMFLIMMGGAAMLLYTPKTHLTPDAADGAVGSAKNDLFDVEWVDDKTIRLKPHR